MWNSEWERQNQEKLKEWYDEQIAGGFRYDPEVREIICFGCGKVFYTRIKSKKYCDYNTCGTIGNYKLQKEQRYQKRKDTVCSVCGKVFTPKRADSKYCSNACRQKAYRERVTVTPSVQNDHEVQA